MTSDSFKVARTSFFGMLDSSWSCGNNCNAKCNINVAEGTQRIWPRPCYLFVDALLVSSLRPLFFEVVMVPFSS